jgi:hypothetical protein
VNNNEDDDDYDEVFSYSVHRYTMGPQSLYFSFVFSGDNRFSESQGVGVGVGVESMLSLLCGSC